MISLNERNEVKIIEKRRSIPFCYHRVFDISYSNLTCWWDCYMAILFIRFNLKIF